MKNRVHNKLVRDRIPDIIEARAWSWEQLEQMRQEKADKRGGFEKKILLKEVIEN